MTHAMPSVMSLTRTALPPVVGSPALRAAFVPSGAEGQVSTPLTAGSCRRLEGVAHVGRKDANR